MLTDLIADFLTRLRNASAARHRELFIPSSSLIKEIAMVLMRKRFVETMEEITDKKNPELKITLRTDRAPLELKRISKPGQRIYVKNRDIKRVRNGLGIGILSTPKGILTDSEAREQKVGGEYICEVY